MSDSRLNDDRINRLNEVGFQWSMFVATGFAPFALPSYSLLVFFAPSEVTNKMKRFYDKQWDQMYDRLREYKQVYGHCLVPKRYALDQKLGTWVHTQRMQYRKSSATGNSIQVDSSSDGNLDVSNESEGSKEESIADRLTADRRQRLDELGFCWSARNVYGADSKKLMSRTSYDDQWDTMFQRFVLRKESTFAVGAASSLTAMWFCTGWRSSSSSLATPVYQSVTRRTRG
jgi:hypothetical protein